MCGGSREVALCARRLKAGWPAIETEGESRGSKQQATSPRRPAQPARTRWCQSTRRLQRTPTGGLYISTLFAEPGFRLSG